MILNQWLWQIIRFAKNTVRIMAMSDSASQLTSERNVQYSHMKTPRSDIHERSASNDSIYSCSSSANHASIVLIWLPRRRNGKTATMVRNTSTSKVDLKGGCEGLSLVPTTHAEEVHRCEEVTLYVSGRDTSHVHNDQYSQQL